MSQRSELECILTKLRSYLQAKGMTAGEVRFASGLARDAVNSRVQELHKYYTQQMQEGD